MTRAYITAFLIILLVGAPIACPAGTKARAALTITGTVVDSEGSPVANKTVYLFPMRAGRVKMTLKVDGKSGTASCCADSSAKTDKQGKFTIEVPKKDSGGELTIGVPEIEPRALSRNGEPLVFRVADRATEKLDLGNLTLFCPNCSPW